MGEPMYRVPRHMAGSLAELEQVIHNDGHQLTGEMPAADNERRAFFALAGLRAYRRVCKGDDIIIETITDFLGDLMHLVDACSNEDGETVNLEWLIEAASVHYEAEIRGEL